MLRAIGLILIMWYLSTIFNQSFRALDNAATATFETVEVAARKTATNFGE